MSDPTTYSESVSTYLKSSPAPATISAVQYVLGDSRTPGINSTDVYSNFYKRGLESSEYSSEFILGNSQAAVKQNILPGDRYFIPMLDIKTPGSKKKCYDESGVNHDLSTLIDNVNRTSVVKDSSNQGLFYSLYASLKDYEKGISNIDLSKNPYTCKPITAFMDDSETKETEIKYVLKSDTEGFIDTAAYKNVKIVVSKQESKMPAPTPGFKAPEFNSSNPPLLNPDGTVKTDSLGIPMYENDGTGGGPTQYSVNSESVKTNQAIMDKLLPPPGVTTGEAALANMQKLFGKDLSGLGPSAFTTIENSDILITKHQNRKYPWSDPIFLFYVGSLGLLFGIIFYKLFNGRTH